MKLSETCYIKRLFLKTLFNDIERIIEICIPVHTEYIHHFL